MSSRYALYYTPSAHTALWSMASAWLGYDAYTGQAWSATGAWAVEPQDRSAAIAAPSRYGFHATLVAPFELAPESSETELAETVAAFCQTLSPFETLLKVGRIDDFLALVPAHEEVQLEALAAACVQGFDRFRAPLSEADWARRNAPHLSEHERTLLKRWGYPHVLDAFRFHLSLTGPLSATALTRLQPALTAWLAPALVQPLAIDGLSLLRQSDRSLPFQCVARFGFAASERALEME